MQLPANLKNALDELFQQTNPAELEKASHRLTQRYRNEILDGKMHIADRNAAFGYIAARFPATYAAVFLALDKVTEICPSFSPSSQLDVGAGPGTAVFAASRIFPSLRHATLVEQSHDIIAIGKTLFSASLVNDDSTPSASKHVTTDWQNMDISSAAFENLAKADLVTASYVLDELPEKIQDHLVDGLWNKTGDMLFLIEPGTPAGFRRLNRQRDRLIERGGHIVAPCPHEFACPVESPDWCHFSVRVERSRTHRLTKQAIVPFEDEKFCYLAFAHEKPDVQYCRILSRPQRSSGKVEYTICTSGGEKNAEITTRRNKKLYSELRRLGWGDILKN